MSSTSASSSPPTSSVTETVLLGPVTTTRIWTGLWQLSSNAWGSVSVPKIRQGMARHVYLGYNTFGKLFSFVTDLFYQHRRPLRYGALLPSITTVILDM